MENNFSKLIKAAGELPAQSPNLERRVMIEIVRRAIERSRKRARLGLIASLSGLAMLLAGCIAALVVWYPAFMPTFTNFSWLEKIRTLLPELPQTDTNMPFIEQWGGLILLVLLIGGAVGFIYYLNNLFPSDYTTNQ